MTANAVCSVSLDPLLALVCFEQSRAHAPASATRAASPSTCCEAGGGVARVFASKVPEAEKLRNVPPGSRTACRSSTQRSPGSSATCAT